MNNFTRFFPFALRQILQSNSLLMAKQVPLIRFGFLLLFVGLLGSQGVMAATKTWSSGTAWGTAVWSPAGTPIAGDDLVFNAAVAMTGVPTISLNSITVNNAFAVTMTAAASGNTITLGAGGLNVTNAGGTFNIGGSGTIVKLTPGMIITATGTIACSFGWGT